MADIPLQLSARVRLAFAQLQRARQTGDEDRIAIAQSRLDWLVDQLPLTRETAMQDNSAHCRKLSRGHKCVAPKGHTGGHRCFCGEQVDWANKGAK